jgi:hypothetical protein
MTTATSAHDRIYSLRFQILVLCVAVIAAALALSLPDTGPSDVLSISRGYAIGVTALVVLWLLCQLIWALVHGMATAKRGNAGATTPHYRTHFANTCWGDIAAALLALITTVSCFTVYKAVAVGADGHGFDAMFIAWDRAIFAGHDPWKLTHAMLATPYATKMIDILYHPAFLPMVLGYVACVSMQGRPALRYTYMGSYLVSFLIIGMVLANAMHSAGPAYDGALFGDGTTFAPLLERLALQNDEAGPFASVFAQRYLLNLHEANGIGFGGGISAMPSMHIVLASLWMFAGWHLSRTLGMILTVYAAVIWIGSVHLGWHYFVDGLIALLVLGVIWYAAGRLFGLFPNAQVIRATT